VYFSPFYAPAILDTRKVRFTQSPAKRDALRSPADRDLPSRPDRFFGDIYVHMNPAGLAEVDPH
jgi:hypothetical protein